MKAQDILTLLLFGLAFWLVGTLYYRLRGHAVLESTPLRLWMNFIVSPLLSAAVCIAVLRWRHTSAAAWAPAMLLIALPGMFGEAIVLLRFSTWMPNLQPSSAGSYGAFLFAAYALVLTIGEVVTLTAAR